MPRILFTGGGSAGHTVPCLAVLSALPKNYQPLYMGTDGIERRLVPETVPFLTVPAPKLERKFTLRNLTVPVRLLSAVRQARRLLRREKPDLVFSKGGYAALPACLAALRLHIPLILHESDLSFGLANRLCAKRCARICTSFPETAKKYPHAVCTGSPIRAELFLADPLRAKRKYFSSPPPRPVLLVFGGGSGSQSLNALVKAALPRLLSTFYILHIVGKKNALPASETGYLPLPYEQDMASAYAASDFVLCRGGSNTLFEVLALKKAALVVPLSSSSRGDQAENAKYFAKKGLVHTAEESALTAETLVTELQKLVADRTLRQNLKRSDFQNGTAKIVQTIEACCKGKP